MGGEAGASDDVAADEMAVVAVASDDVPAAEMAVEEADAGAEVADTDAVADRDEPQEPTANG